MSEYPTFTVLILNWNGRRHLERCLPSIMAQEYPHFEVVLIDNASTDDSVAFVREQFPAVRVIQNEANLGFAEGMNIGLRQSDAPLISLLNNDVVLKPGWLTAMAEAFQAQAEIGIAGCKIFYPDEVTLQHAGGIMRYPQALPDHYGHLEQDEGQHEQLRQVDYVTGAALTLRQAMLEDIGLLDEGYQFYFEESDLCFRARRATWQVVYLPQAVAIHHESASIGRNSYAYYRRFHTSRFRFILKRYGANKLLHEVLPAELGWLQQVSSLEEAHALQQAYLETLLTVGGVPVVDGPLSKAQWQQVKTALQKLRATIPGWGKLLADKRWQQKTTSTIDM